VSIRVVAPACRAVASAQAGLNRPAKFRIFILRGQKLEHLKKNCSLIASGAATSPF
jgi:hypothetical protein